MKAEPQKIKPLFSVPAPRAAKGPAARLKAASDPCSCSNGGLSDPVFKAAASHTIVIQFDKGN